MEHRISPDHPLAKYHRPQHHAVAPEDMYRQWGEASLDASPPFIAGSWQTLTLTWTVGSMGIDENGGIRLSFRFVSDMGNLQTDRPEDDNYVSASTSGTADIELVVRRKGNRRPFQKSLFVNVRNATLNPGDTITIVLGDSSAGGRGWRQQTYVESPCPMRLSVDPLGTHDYADLPHDLGWDIVPGPMSRLVAMAPSIAVVGRPLLFRVKAEDRWGNPLRNTAELAPQLQLLTPSNAALPVTAGTHERGVWLYQVTPQEVGVHTLSSSEHDLLFNPINVVEQAPGLNHYWTDLHGQTGETVGVGTIEEYFDFARHYGGLAATTPQGNDFQITQPLWAHIKKASDDAYEPGEFVTFKAYEWSGNTPMGGDHNVIYHEDDPPLYRSSGWLDQHPFEEVAPLENLYATLKKHNALTMAHIGGRPASLEISDPDIEPVVELHSAWGTFEWVYEKCFERGFQVGFVCNSDGHKCRPGASYPGAGIFGTLGGLTCILAAECTRDAFWDALKQRRCYGTTGQRILVDANLNGQPIGADVVADDGEVVVDVVGTAPLVAVELMHKAVVIDRWLPKFADSANLLVIRFGGARVHGRARIVHWEGTVQLDGNTIVDAQCNGCFNPENGIQSQGRAELAFKAVTSGNTMNLCLQLAEGMTGILKFTAGPASFEVDIETLTQEHQRFFDAPVDQRVELFVVHQASLPQQVSHRFAQTFTHTEPEPYFLRVTQLDEAKAWTSPFYVRTP